MSQKNEDTCPTLICIQTSPLSEEWTMEERFRPLTFHSIIFAVPVGQPAHPCYTENQSSATQPRLSYAEMTEDYPCFPGIHNLDLALLNPRMIVDVTPYMNPCPYTVSPNTHVSQVFNLLRTMGLQRLPVVNAVVEIVGIITRHNLTQEFLLQKPLWGLWGHVSPWASLTVFVLWVGALVVHRSQGLLESLQEILYNRELAWTSQYFMT
ncbi:unnamed protein product [Oncorhynchus mykiss]|uniref:CBS domain-containing protein n=1 Tax=Oncorhynchus mykiss TaxID=8022 RepID=A0A060XH79_ONCMY|nr:unnamed protein product [Oncorhynchus mykiss]